ncbi:hypothetical protein [Phormidium pseudopriestleyi]|nr:hypothetical protein [Phormidium pseudopriestleyi]
MVRSRHSYSIQLHRANINHFLDETTVLVKQLINENQGVSIL